MSTPTSNNGKQTSIHRPKDAPFTIHNSILYDQKLRALRAEAEALRLQLGYVRPLPSFLTPGRGFTASLPPQASFAAHHFGI